MPHFSHPATQVLMLALLLVPAPSPTPRRDVERDVTSLRQSECEYRGITATYDELTRAYILEVYHKGQLLRWQSQPSPHNPDSETLVTAIYEVRSVTARDDRAFINILRQNGPPHIGVTWRYSTLAATRIAPANDYARDALETFTRTVDAFISRMAIAKESFALSSSPGATPERSLRVDKGTVLLVEDQHDEWALVRHPATKTSGWIHQNVLQPVEE